MCVIGAGRRARRGETVQQILAQYYPGLEIAALEGVTARAKSETVIAVNSPIPRPRTQSPAASTSVTIRGVLSQPSELQQAAARAHQAMTRALGTAGVPVTVDVHDTVEGFRQATGKPWWVSASVTGTIVDLAPLTLLTQREGIDVTLRAAMAQAMMAEDLQGRPEWVRVGGARYFSRPTPMTPPDAKAKLKCPADAELTLAISATAQRDAESRAEACFARAFAATRDWKAVN
jgi:hypothetical protein